MLLKSLQYFGLLVYSLHMGILLSLGYSKNLNPSVTVYNKVGS